MLNIPTGEGGFCPHRKMDKYVYQAAQAVAGVKGEGLMDQEVVGTGFFTQLGQAQYFFSVRHLFESWNERNRYSSNRRALLPDGKEISLCVDQVINLGRRLSGWDLFAMRIPNWVNVPHLELAPEGGRGIVNQSLGYVIGNPYEFLKTNPEIAGPVVSWGSYYTERLDRTRIVCTDARIEPGNSGSPLLNSANLAVEGIVYASGQVFIEEAVRGNNDDSPGVRLGLVSPSFRLYDFFDRFNF